MAEFTKHQQKVIKNYYEHREGIALQRVQEIVTELYLSTGKKRQKQWESLRLHLPKLGVKPDVIEHMIREDKPELVAKLVEKLMARG
jgi:hypothetical protein